MACVKLVGSVVSGIINTGERCSSSEEDTCTGHLNIIVNLTYELREQHSFQRITGFSFVSRLINVADCSLLCPSGQV